MYHPAGQLQDPDCPEIFIDGAMILHYLYAIVVISLRVRHPRVS